MKTLMVLVGIFAVLIISGCIGQSAETPAPVATTAAPVDAESSITTETGSAQAFGEGIIKCLPGTPWEFTTEASTGAYKASYTIEGKKLFKGGEFCKVKGKIEAAGGMGGLEEMSYDYYFKVDPTGISYSDVWFVMSIPGQPTQEIHVTSGSPAQ